MKFEAYAALAKLRDEGEARAIHAIRAIQPVPNSTSSTNSAGQTVESENVGSHQVARIALPPVSKPEITPPIAPAPSRDTEDPFRHGRAPGNRPVTWCGKIVSLDEWRKLSAWDRHGPDGRMFCGACREWVMLGGCPHCDGAT